MREAIYSLEMTWPERIDIILRITAHVPWNWFVMGMICGMMLGVALAGIAVVVVGLEET